MNLGCRRNLTQWAVVFLSMSTMGLMVGLALEIYVDVKSDLSVSPNTNDATWKDWPYIGVAIDEEEENEITRILDVLNWEEKIYQMIQPSFSWSLSTIDTQPLLGPGELLLYPLGSIRFCADGFPTTKRMYSWPSWDAKRVEVHACEFCRESNSRVAEYVAIIEEFHKSNEAYWKRRSLNLDMELRIPFMTASDWDNGLGLVPGATRFPMPINLGALRESDLLFNSVIETYLQDAAASAFDWIMWPPVDVPRDDRAKIVYRAFSEDAQVIYNYSHLTLHNMISKKDKYNVLATVDGWGGGGGMIYGKNGGDNWYDESAMRNVLLPGALGALEGGALTVRMSRGSWMNTANYDVTYKDEYEYKHAIYDSRYLINDVLKNDMGFLGLVVADLGGLDSLSSPLALIEAGVDVVNVPYSTDWKKYADEVLLAINNETDERYFDYINNAVRRILRVKMRAGLWERQSPLGVACYNPVDKICAIKSCELTWNEGAYVLEKPYGSIVPCGRDASRESVESPDGMGIVGSESATNIAKKTAESTMVLLKNNESVMEKERALPVTEMKGLKFVVQGNAATDWGPIIGGALPGLVPESFYDSYEHPAIAICEKVQLYGGECVIWDGVGSGCDDDEVYTCFNLLGEVGEERDLVGVQTLSFLDDGMSMVDIKSRAKRTVTILFSSRPLYVVDLLNASDSFVAAFRPGASGVSVLADILIQPEEDSFSSFVGILRFTWPNRKCDTTVNRTPFFYQNWQMPNWEQSVTDLPDTLQMGASFNYGFGLTFLSDTTIPQIREDDTVLGCRQEGYVPSTVLEWDTCEVMVEPGEVRSWQAFIDRDTATKRHQPLCSVVRDPVSQYRNFPCEGVRSKTPPYTPVFTFNTNCEELECGPSELIHSVIQDDGILMFKSLDGKGIRYMKEVSIVPHEPLDWIEHYYGRSRLCFDISVSEGSLTCNNHLDSSCRLGIGLQLGDTDFMEPPHLTTRVYYDIQDWLINFLDSNESWATAEKASYTRICMRLNCWDRHYDEKSNQPTLNWGKITHAFILSTPQHAEIALKNIRVEPQQLISSAEEIVCDNEHFFGSFTDWLAS